MAARRRGGFTAEELIAALAIIMLGVAVISLVTRNGPPAARATSCASNLQQLGLAMRMYADDNDGRTPPGPHEFVAIYPYLKNNQVLKCPEDETVARGGPSDLPEGMEVSETVSYLMRPGVRTDGVPSTLIAADDAPDRHARRTWNAVRLDGAMQRRPAERWDEFWWEVMADAEMEPERLYAD
jgi:hypothetical protein